MSALCAYVADKQIGTEMLNRLRCIGGISDRAPASGRTCGGEDHGALTDEGTEV